MMTSLIMIWVSNRSQRLSSHGHDYTSSLANQEVVCTHFTTKVSCWHFIGPLAENYCSFVDISPIGIGLVPKDHTSRKQWMVVDLSSYEQFSMNSSISRDLWLLLYALLDDALKLVSHFGAGTRLVKWTSRAHTELSLYTPGDHCLLRLTWKGSLFMLTAHCHSA